MIKIKLLQLSIMSGGQNSQMLAKMATVNQCGQNPALYKGQKAGDPIGSTLLAIILNLSYVSKLLYTTSV